MVKQQKAQLNYHTVRKFSSLVVGDDWRKDILVENNAGEVKVFLLSFSKYTFQAENSFFEVVIFKKNGLRS
jgi:hypothetical protein